MNPQPFTARELVNCTLTQRSVEIDGGRETILVRIDAEGRKMTKYFWVAENERFSCSFATPALCRNFRRLWFGHSSGRKFIRQEELEKMEV